VADGPRPLSAKEQAILSVLLARDFPGAAELRRQADTAKVKAQWPDDPTIVLAVDKDLPRARIAYQIPVEARVREKEPPREVLLHVKDGYLDILELVVYGNDKLTELPDPETLDEPSINPWILED
jgi:hypothetical protein